MTPKEALDYMENEIRCIQRARYCDRDCANCALVKEDKPLIEAFGKAIEALEKQIPKKVTHEATLRRCCTCPTCKNVVDKFEKWGESTVRITYNHCQICGQALDWNDGERKGNGE